MSEKKKSKEKTRTKCKLWNTDEENEWYANSNVEKKKK